MNNHKNIERFIWGTIADRNRLIKQLSVKHNAPTIAKQLGISKRTVYRAMKKLGIVSVVRPKYYGVSADDELLIAKLYLTCSSGELAKRFGVSNDTIVNICKRHKVPIKSSKDALRQAVKYGENSHFEILNCENAYLIGLICADGCIYGEVLTIGLKRSDGDLIRSIQKQLQLGTVSEIRQNGFGLTRIRISRRKICRDLVALGVSKFKHDNPAIIEDMNDEIFKKFMAGFFDGDGILCKTRSQCGFVGTENIMAAISLRLHKLGFKMHIYKHDSIFKMITSHKQIMCKFLQWILPELRLKRKRRLAVDWIKRLTYKINWHQGIRFSIGDFRAKPPGYRIKVVKEIMHKIKKWAPLEYSNAELYDDLNEIKCEINSLSKVSGVPTKTQWQAGRKISTHFNPHLWSVRYKNSPTIIDAWNNTNLRRCLQILINTKASIDTERLIRELQFQTRAKTASLFQPALAAYIIRQFKISGSIFDPCGGWGGRLLAAHLMGIKYRCCEINENTANGLAAIDNFISGHANIINDSCFNIDWGEETIVTSPPFGSEDYSNKSIWDDQHFFNKIKGHHCVVHVNEEKLIEFAAIREPAAVLNVRTRSLHGKWHFEYLMEYR